MSKNEIVEQIRDMKGTAIAETFVNFTTVRGEPDHPPSIRDDAEREVWLRSIVANFGTDQADRTLLEYRARAARGATEQKLIEAAQNDRHLYMFAMGSRPSDPIAEVVCRQLTAEERERLDAFFVSLGAGT